MLHPREVSLVAGRISTWHMGVSSQDHPRLKLYGNPTNLQFDDGRSFCPHTIIRFLKQANIKIDVAPLEGRTEIGHR